MLDERRRKVEKFQRGESIELTENRFQRIEGESQRFDSRQDIAGEMIDGLETVVREIQRFQLRKTVLVETQSVVGGESIEGQIEPEQLRVERCVQLRPLQPVRIVNVERLEEAEIGSLASIGRSRCETIIDQGQVDNGRCDMFE